MSEQIAKKMRERGIRVRRAAAADQSMQDRRSDYDVTDTVQVSSVSSVREAVRDLFQQTYPSDSFDKLWLVFYDFERLFGGRLPGYLGCDTTYHDTQHSLDMTLAMARLIAGYERSASPELQLGPKRAELGIVTSLFHDAGYIRHIERDREYRNGAEFTLYHVSRSADFLRSYLPQIGRPELATVAGQIVHFTGYEIDLDHIELEDPRDTFCGHLLGTADLMAQMADRCYLEKCRDRLYSEFVIGGIAVGQERPGEYMINYSSGEDLLRKTPEFVASSAFDRLDKVFGKAYRYIEVLFDGRNPYMEAIEQNMKHLETVLVHDDFSLLRRQPPCFVSERGSLKTVREMVEERLGDSRGKAENDS